MTELRAENFRVASVKLASILCFLMLSFCYGCGGKPVWLRDDPDEVLAGFLQTTEAQSTETMWEYLSSETRRKLEERAEAFNADTSNGEKRRGRDMLRAGHVLSSTREYKKLEVAASDDKEAVVNIVMHDETIIAVKLYREDGRWAVTLPL